MLFVLSFCIVNFNSNCESHRKFEESFLHAFSVLRGQSALLVSLLSIELGNAGFTDSQVILFVSGSRNFIPEFLFLF